MSALPQVIGLGFSDIVHVLRLTALRRTAGKWVENDSMRMNTESKVGGGSIWAYCMNHEHEPPQLLQLWSLCKTTTAAYGPDRLQESNLCTAP